MDTWNFKSVEVKQYVESLVSELEKTNHDIEDYNAVLLSLSGENPLEEAQTRVTYTELLQEAMDRAAQYQEMIRQYTTSEYLAENGEPPITNEEYWENLAGKENPTIADFADDMLALQDSVEDSGFIAEKADAEYTEVEEAAKESISKAEALLDEKESSALLSHIYDIMQSNPEAIKSNLTEEQAKEMSDLLESIGKWKNAAPLSKEQYTDATKDAVKLAIGKHPIQYAIASMRQTMSEVSSARQYYKVARGGFLQNIGEAMQVSLLPISSVLEPVKTAVLESARNGVQFAAGLLNSASMTFADITNKAKESLISAQRSLEKICDKTLDALTLGAWAKIGPYVDKLDAKRMASLEASLQNGPEKGFVGKIRYLSDKMEYAIRKHDAKVRGVDSETYWKDITDNAFFWGNMTGNADVEKAYSRSPVQFAQDKIESGINKIAAFAGNVAKEVETDARTVGQAVFDFKADVMEKAASMYEKKERRLQSKMERLNNINRTVFNNSVDLQKSLHDLIETAPFVRPQYEPNPQIQAALKSLESMRPTGEVAFAKVVLQKELERAEKKFNKKQDRMEGWYAKNLEKMSVTASKLSTLQDKISGIKDIAIQAREKASEIGPKVADAGMER